ncbi:hypothetical protein INT45_001352 [Circinella minor]|uniref:Tc1-like transposase DDE domain-containing protein n=1 Tax=Circinella minor TaxID=1195481 RepID=A0A8H7RRW7_9FUNG|nr:hypothetical protein INT45_001352 [Circinella minor]
MTDPELPERMAQLEKTIEASNTSKTKYADYSDSQKTLFLYYLQLKFLSAAASARKAAINVRTGQDWAKKLKNDPDFDIFEKNTNKTVRKGSQLQEEHKAHLIEFFDDNPHARVSDAVEELTKNFEGFTLKETVVGKFISTECNLSIKKITRHPVARNQNAKIKERREWVETWAKTDMDYTKNCIFIDESAFDINMKPPTARSARGTPAIVTSPSARAVSHTILGAISTCGVVNMEIRVPLTPKRIKVVGAQKRKATAVKSKATGGTNAGHYNNFIKKTMDEMDKYPQFEGFYMIMDNSPIHGKNGELRQLVESRGYKCVYLPPYSPELNPIEQFWAIVKGKVRRSQFGNTEDLKTRISEACDQVPRNHLRNFAQHSVKVFEDCLNELPI